MLADAADDTFSHATLRAAVFYAIRCFRHIDMLAAYAMVAAELRCRRLPRCCTCFTPAAAIDYYFTIDAYAARRRIAAAMFDVCHTPLQPPCFHAILVATRARHAIRRRAFF